MGSNSIGNSGHKYGKLIKENYEEPKDSDKNVSLFNEDVSHLLELQPLKTNFLYIVQPKVDLDFFHPNITHEIYNEKKHLLFKGNSKRNLLAKKNWKKISICNLNNKKIVTVDFGSDKITSMSSEAIISCPADCPRGRVTKYGGRYEQPSYEISSIESDKKILFTVENSAPCSPSSSSSLDYTIFKASRHKVGHVTSKSGLNFMLHVKEGSTILDKAVLLGFIIAMDVLKQGKSVTKINQYEYND